MGDLAVVLVVVLVVVLIWRGPKTLPRLGEALGRGVREARQQAGTDGDADPTDPAAPSPDGDRRP
jgi:Sec-independent protein translocase protein TatA